jgi:hypothetical protein
MNHAQGYNNNAYTLDANGQLVFNTAATFALIKNQIKVYRDGVLLQTETVYLANNGVYTVPAQYNGETVDHALCNGQEYAVGKSLENNGETLAGLRFTNGLKRHLNKGSFKLTWFGAANDTANGTLFTLRFKVLQNKSLRVGLTLQPNTAYNADCTADA